MLERAIEFATPLVTRQRHLLRVGAGAEEVTLRGDPVRLAQVFGNLLTNAAKFSHPRAATADAGFDCHFVKPVSVQDLVTALDERVVERSARGGGRTRMPRGGGT